MDSPSRARQRVQALLLVLLLIGSLLPARDIRVVTIAGALLVPMVLWVVVRGFPAVPKAAVLASVLALTVAVAVYLGPPSTEYGAQKAQTFFLLTVPTAAVALLITNRATLVTLAKVWVAIGCVLAVLALVGEADSSGRATGWSNSNPIWLARAIGAPLVALLWLVYRRAVGKSALAIGALLLAGMYATGSRGPMVALMIGLLLVVTMSAATVRLARAAAVTLAVAAGLYLAVMLEVISTTSRIGAILVDFRGELEASGRGELARATFGVIAEHPWGVGFGNWVVHVPQPAHRYPHNLWLEMLAENGWLIGGFFIVTVAWVFCRLWWAARTEPAAGLVLALLAFEATAVTSTGDLNARTFFFLLTLGYAVSGWTPTVGRSRLVRNDQPLTRPDAIPLVPAPVGLTWRASTYRPVTQCPPDR
ncbi:O-antigen ligase family protein [Micromonospora sp. C51]|uniref:O-antigen ligase family protein n=1 Tax=Micromonospora sp. C51 TaxID=2824879 RepID=UPI001B3661F9|nr:O-antigen ligase family protein [Micromonospora sp. C51]MBQ1047993.1 O-antigen ligase family protein [Micromonospora sp. C51]